MRSLGDTSSNLVRATKVQYKLIPRNSEICGDFQFRYPPLRYSSFQYLAHFPVRLRIRI